ncbi:arginine--tRNA ligase [Tautonia plasticadhaerens]|uniref:Arginine--tRNA ligase n=1 Tax=Tautonia plasticadhaerens TaxID=2527974 RepID=A0A518H7G1_9BACT|nr:arginine--tRNA ligase [Tautonia plasticadhaerens]QDV36755.1 Arginine--tRNA ligase [Tautonia plasticadhaerens]
MNVLHRLRRAFAAASPEGASPDAFAQAVRPSTDPKFGDYQANGCMAAAKATGRNPRELASAVADRVDLGPMAEAPEVAGPGFLNVRLRDDWISAEMSGLLADDRLGVEPTDDPQTIIIDYSSPNVAKPMHVGHIRSTVIGESVSRILSSLGHKVIRDNHLGDWGLQFGQILWGWKNHLDPEAYDREPVAELARLYRLSASKMKAAEELAPKLEKVRALERQGKPDEAASLFSKLFDDAGMSREQAEAAVAEARAVTEASRQETAKLHAGDPENRKLWEQFMPHCLEALEGIYHRLGVRFDVQLGESFYDAMLTEVVESLKQGGLAEASEGATVVFTESTKAPMIVQKRDGAFTYATSDLAKVKYCEDEFDADRLLYVVDSRQGDHFKQVFDVARRWGYADVDFDHVAFGTILGTDRKPFRTRSGDVVGLESLLDEAVAKAREVVEQNSGHLPEDERARVAEVVGIGAVKYADLSQNRLSDYVFDLDKMVAMIGNTATYLQYAYARTRSIFRKGETTPEAIRRARPTILITHPAERALGVALLRLPETLEAAAAELKPNVLADYLFGLANLFSGFFDACPVLKAESAERRDSRLALCDLTGRTLAFGLELLGIEVVDRM